MFQTLGQKFHLIEMRFLHIRGGTNMRFQLISNNQIEVIDQHKAELIVLNKRRFYFRNLIQKINEDKNTSKSYLSFTTNDISKLI
jgi:hypothetical protein